MARAYSSMEALVAHWRALCATRGASSATERELLDAMRRALDALDPVERAALESAEVSAALPADTSAVNARNRRCERALIKLHAILGAAGWLQ